MANMWDRLADVDPVVYFLSFSAALKHVLAYMWQDRLPKDAQQVGTVSRLFIHPIKSTKGIEIEEGECTPMAIKSGEIYDRHMIVVSGEKQGLTAKHVTPIATVTTRVEGDVLYLSAPGQQPVSVNWKQAAKSGRKERFMMHCQVAHEGKDCGDEVGRWFDSLIGKPGHRLVFRDPSLTYRRTVINSTKKYAAWTKVAKEEDEVAYQDCTPYMLMSNESMDDLNDKMGKEMEWDRFKPNIIVSGTKLYDEDTWKHICIGDARFTTVKLCGRCVLVTVDPNTGVKESKQDDPLVTLRKYRCVVPSFGESPCMGIMMVLDRPGNIRVGDPVYATRGSFTTPPE